MVFQPHRDGFVSHSIHLLSRLNFPIVLPSLALLSLAVYIVYQLFLHPLAKYPGPFLGRLTRWYDVYHSYIGDKHILLYHLHQRHGPIVRFTPSTLSINDPAAMKEIYSHGANATKSVFYETFRARPDAISTFLTTNVHDHARKRRVLGQAFSETAMRGLEEHVVGHIDDFIRRIRNAIGQRQQRTGKPSTWSNPIDLSKWNSWLVFDIMGDLVFGRSFGTLGDRPSNRQGIHLLSRAARRNYTCAAMPGLATTGVERFLPWLRGLARDRDAYLAFGMKQVRDRMAEGNAGEADVKARDRKDIFTFLLKARDPETGEGFRMGELWMEGNTLIVAGSDSTSTALSAILYYVVKHPSVLSRLTSEIRKAFSSPESIRSGPALHSCTYLRACIDESLRMTPSLGGLLPREVQVGGLELNSLGISLPAGTTVGTPVYAIQHHEEYVVDPFVFDPERWLEGGGQGNRKQDLSALQAVFSPFSVGRHACIGKPLVYMELSLAVARLLWEFDLKLAGDQKTSGFLLDEVKAGKRVEGEYHLLDWFMSKNEGPWLEIRPRESL